jgi:CRP-like cAMP-binding protein
LLLDSLSEPTRKRLLSHLRPVALPIKARLYDPEEEPRHVHFLDSGLASIVVSMADGGTVEVATVGREGMPQGMHLLGPTPVPTRCFMQIGGHGLRMDFKAFAKIYAEEEEVRRSILGYAQYRLRWAARLWAAIGCMASSRDWRAGC